MLTIKYSSMDGRMLWQRRHDGGSTFPFIRNDSAMDLAVDRQGNVVVTGYSETASGTNSHYTAKYSGTDGTLLWESRNPGETSSFGVVLATDSSDHVFVTGVWNNAQGFATSYILKLNPDGSRAWFRVSTLSAAWHTALAVDCQGDVIVLGVVYSGNAENNSYYVAKHAGADGTLVWEKRSHDMPPLIPLKGHPLALATGLDGDVIITGTHDGHFHTARYAGADGELLWETFDSREDNWNSQGTVVLVDSRGDVVITGPTGDSEGVTGYYTAKYGAENGALLWERFRKGPTVGGFGTIFGFQTVTLDGEGHVVVAGSGFGATGGRDYDYYTAKYSAANGAVIWERTFSQGLVGGYDVPRAVVADAEGNVIVTGESDGGETHADFYTVKYSAADGGLLWEQRQVGFAARVLYPAGAALDDGGNLAVTAVTFRTLDDGGSLSDADFYTAKYTIPDGRVLWERHYGGPGNDQDEPSALTVDRAGNVIVTGASYLGGGDKNQYTAKYAATDGAILWATRTQGGGSMALDAKGDIILAGVAWNKAKQDLDFYAAKLATSDGKVLWEHRASVSAKGRNTLNDVAVDKNGDVIVTGSSCSWLVTSNSVSQVGCDYYTAKFASQDGRRIWERFYDGPSHGMDVAYAVALDSLGNAVVSGVSDDRVLPPNVVDQRLCTLKLAAEDGSIQWLRREEDSSNYSGGPVELAVDAKDDVVLSMPIYARDRPRLSDVYTAKYAGAGGARIWASRYNGPADRSDLVRGLTLDEEGNVIVAGFSGSNSWLVDVELNEIFAAKYAAKDGALLWEKRLAGAVTRSVLARDPGGVVIVGGSMVGEVVIAGYEEVPAVSIDLVQNGVRVGLTGVAGRHCQIEKSPTVRGPWNLLTSAVLSADGRFEHVDTERSPVAAFYRVVIR